MIRLLDNLTHIVHLLLDIISSWLLCLSRESDHWLMLERQYEIGLAHNFRATHNEIIAMTRWYYPPRVRRFARRLWSLHCEKYFPALINEKRQFNG